jgi:hypothetical protein
MDATMRNGMAELNRSAARTRLLWALAVLALAVVLLAPAAYNRFPLIFPDTSAYFSVAWANSWPVDRAGFYGLFLAPVLRSVAAVPAMWLAVFAQAGVIALVLIAVLHRIWPDASPIAAFALTAALALTTSLSWHASQLLPDAFTGAVVLLAWLAASRNMGDRGTPLLWLATGIITLLHFTHTLIVAAVILATMLVHALSGTPFKELARRTLAAALMLAAVFGSHTVMNGVNFNRWTPSPLGGYFLFARLHQDGLVPRWFDRHCGIDAPKPLCDIRGTIPHNMEVLLWSHGQYSPFVERINKKIGSPESWRWAEMTAEAARGSLREEPVAFARNAAIATAGQFVHFQALEDECPENCRNLMMFKWQPSLIEPMRASRQLSGELPKREIRILTSIPAVMGLLLLLPLLVAAIRRRDVVAQSLLSATIVGLLSNAAVAGALSHVDNRYQSRVVWIAPFVVLLIAARWYAPSLSRLRRP